MSCTNSQLSAMTGGYNLLITGGDQRVFNYIMYQKGTGKTFACIATSETTIYSKRSMGKVDDGEIIFSIKPGTVFKIFNVTYAEKMMGNSSSIDEDANEMSACVQIMPDANSQVMSTSVVGYVQIKIPLTFTILENEKRVLSEATTTIEKYCSTVEDLDVSQLILEDNKLNSSQIVDMGVAHEYNQHMLSITGDSDRFSTIQVNPPNYYATYPESWEKIGNNIQEVADYWNTLGSMDISKYRGIFGMPYQYLPTTDCRIDNSEKDYVFGLTYSEMIASRLPILFLTPGEPVFLSDKKKERQNLLERMIGWMSGDDDGSALNSLLEDYAGKFYSIETKYAQYYKYVNPMCRIGAVFLGLDKEDPEDPDYNKLDGVPIINYNWAWNDNGDYNGDYSGNDEGGAHNTEFSDIADNLKDLQKAIYYKSAIPFYINSEVQFADQMTNETTESSLASQINGMSDKARELQYLLGTTTSIVAENFDAVSNIMASSKQQLDDMLAKLGSSNNIFSSLVNNLRTVVSGGRLLFPNIWSNSGFSKSYSITINLTTPNYDKKSWFLNIYVPLCHLMALVLPRGEFKNGYAAPFIIKAFYAGMFNIDMGIITDMSITKGKEGGWTKDGLPTVVQVQLTLQDLYSTLSMSPAGVLFKANVLQNTAEMDYLANLCGINYYEIDTLRMVRMYEVLNFQNIFNDVATNFTTGLQNTLINSAVKKYNKIFKI